MKIIRIFLLSILAITFNCSADIYQINSINEIKPYLLNVGVNQLVIFDVDDVLIRPKDQLLRSCNKVHLNKFIKDTEEKYSLENSESIWSVMWNSHEVQLVEPAVANIIRDLQASGVKSIALTKANTGKYGVIDSIENHRIKQLADLDIKFQALIEDKNYTALQCKHCRGNPSHRQGIFFTCGLQKQLVLELALQDMGYIPEKIIFIDDHVDNLQNISDYCKSNNIEFIGLHYVAVARAQSPIDFNVVKQQIDALYTQGVWLPDSIINNIKVQG